MTTFAINDFCRRQLGADGQHSEFSYFDGTDAALLELIALNFDKKTEGYREGVVLVPVDSFGFFSSIVPVTKSNCDALSSEFKARREGEKPYLSHRFEGYAKSQALRVQLVLYSHSVLAEDNSNSTEADWELVSINADPTEEESPMHPVTMARNFLAQTGGTKGTFSAEQFAHAIDFWSRHAQVKGQPQ